MAQKIITISFYLLFVVTPWVWTPFNFELFEFNKMLFVYALTVVITSAWIYKMVGQKSLIFKHTILDIPLLIFLASQVLSTIFSIDSHISIWGYYSRLNGGLLSTISYLLLFWAFVSNISTKEVPRMLLAAVFSGSLISLWAILERFIGSPSCLILRGELNTACWVQDVSARVFATLGQPNWLAAYLSMLIFPALYFLLTAKTKITLATHYILLTTIYLAFTFTYSNGGTGGFLAGLAVFLATVIYSKKSFAYSHRYLKQKIFSNFKPLFITLGIFLTINLAFGFAPTKRLGIELTNLLPKPTTTSAPSPTNPPLVTGTQLEIGGAETGKIRLIVWQGALDIFKHYPVFGSGVETFAYSYYNFRPTAHNLTSEWDFLYNKAHNEYLNYLATTGLVGFAAYMAVIITFLIWAVRYVLCIKGDKSHTANYLLIPALLASYVSYLVQNIVEFSVVIIAVFFYTFAAMALVASGSSNYLKLPKTVSNLQLAIYSFFYRRSIYVTSAKILIVAVGIYLLYSVSLIWYADTIFAKGQKNSEVGNAGRAFNLLQGAFDLREEPFYQSELGYAAASAALALSGSDATLSASLALEADQTTKNVLSSHPKNVSFWRTAIRTYYLLAATDQKYSQQTLQTIDQAIKLAPTDPKLYYNRAIILGSIDKTDEAIESLQQAIYLKPNYREAYIALGLFYFDRNERQKAVDNLHQALKILPNDPEALKYLIDWGKQGIATKSPEVK